jgi:hypothetical protein
MLIGLGNCVGFCTGEDSWPQACCLKWRLIELGNREEHRLRFVVPNCKALNSLLGKADNHLLYANLVI